MAKISKRNVETLICDGDRPVFLWDESLSGFGVKALSTGKRQYLIKYRSNGGGRAAPQRWLTLGSHGQLTPDQARSLAQQALAAVARSEDPQSDKFRRRIAPRLRDVWAKFEEEHLPRKKPQTAKEYSSQWHDIISVQLEETAVGDMTRADISKLHSSLSDTPYRANRVIGIMLPLDDAGRGVGMARPRYKPLSLCYKIQGAASKQISWDR